MHNLFNHKS